MNLQKSLAARNFPVDKTKKLLDCPLELWKVLFGGSSVCNYKDFSLIDGSCTT